MEGSEEVGASKDAASVSINAILNRWLNNRPLNALMTLICCGILNLTRTFTRVFRPCRGCTVTWAAGVVWPWTHCNGCGYCEQTSVQIGWCAEVMFLHSNGMT